MDTNWWKQREERYVKKFSAGRKFIHKLFDGIEVPSSIEQIALFGLGIVGGLLGSWAPH